MTTTQRDTAAYLREVYSRQAQVNPSFSLRAFARRLGISPGGLSQILGRKKRLSLQRAHEFAQRLGLTGSEAEYFLLLVQLDSAESLSLRAALSEKLRALSNQEGSVHNLELEQFRLISEWHGLAILEYLSTDRPTGVREIASFFDLPASAVQTTLERLLRLELIEPTTEGSFRRVPERVLIEASVPNEAVRNYYSGVLERAQQSVQTQTPKEKVIGTEVFNFDPADLQEARELTDAYFRQLTDLAARGKNRTAVYQAVVNVFRLNAVKKTVNVNRKKQEKSS